MDKISKAYPEEKPELKLKKYKAFKRQMETTDLQVKVADKIKLKILNVKLKHLNDFQSVKWKNMYWIKILNTAVYSHDMICQKL